MYKQKAPKMLNKAQIVICTNICTKCEHHFMYLCNSINSCIVIALVFLKIHTLLLSALYIHTLQYGCYNAACSTLPSSRVQQQWQNIKRIIHSLRTTRDLDSLALSACLSAWSQKEESRMHHFPRKKVRERGGGMGQKEKKREKWS